MTLMTARPWRHPESGVYYLRRAIPKELRPLLGGAREVKFRLKTRDPREAKQRHAKHLAELEAKWANLRQPVTTISEREAHERASEFYNEVLARFADNPTKFSEN